MSDWVSETRHRSLERAIAAQSCGHFVELRGGVAIAPVGEVGIPKNQIDRDAHQRLVSGEARDSIHFTFERPCEVGGKEGGASDIFAHVMGEIGVAASRDQAMPHDDMGR